EETRAGDVSHVDEVPRLVPVLVDERRTVVQETRGEDRGYARVGVGQRLPLAEHVEEAKRDGGDSVGGADREHELLAVALTDRLHRRRSERFRLGRRLGLERTAVVAEHVPL